MQLEGIVLAVQNPLVDNLYGRREEDQKQALGIRKGSPSSGNKDAGIDKTANGHVFNLTPHGKSAT